MANTLKMAEVYAIYALLERGWSRRRIAQALGIDRETVTRYARLAAAAQSEAPPGLAAGEAAAPNRSGPERSGQSHCEPFRAVILAKLEQGLSATRIHQDLVAEHGFSAKYHSVRRFVRSFGRAAPLPFRRMECAPAEQAQSDFGRGAPLVAPDAQRRIPHVLRVILSHSRKGYSQVVARQSTEDFIRALENAFHQFGGVLGTLVPDSLKAAALKADWFDPQPSPKVQALCQRYGTALLPTRPRRPRHKGKCQAGVELLQSNALKGRQLTTLADTRTQRTTRRQVGKVFAEVERPALLPLPIERFPFFQEAERIVNRDGHVEVAKACYSAPPQLVGPKVWVRWDGHVVRVFDLWLRRHALSRCRRRGQVACRYAGRRSDVRWRGGPRSGTRSSGEGHRQPFGHLRADKCTQRLYAMCTQKCTQCGATARSSWPAIKRGKR